MYDPIYELEHYGVKGMKWDQEKRRGTKKDYNNVSFWDISPIELPQYLKAKKEKASGPRLPVPAYTPRFKKKPGMYASINNVNKRLKAAKQWLYKLSGKSVGGISEKTASIGRGATSRILKTHQYIKKKSNTNKK